MSGVSNQYHFQKYGQPHQGKDSGKPPLYIGYWNTERYEIKILVSNPLQAQVYSKETGQTNFTPIKADFSKLSNDQLSANQEAIQEAFRARVIHSTDQTPVSVEFSVRGYGGGKAVPISAPIYSKNTSHGEDIPQGNASVDKVPKTPQELVWVMRRLKSEDPRYKKYLANAEPFLREFAKTKAHSQDQIDGLVLLVLLDDKEITLAVISHLIQRIKEDVILPLPLVGALAHAIDRVRPSYLNDDDLVQLLSSLMERLTKTHSTAKASQGEQLKAIARITNAMADACMRDIPRDTYLAIEKTIKGFAESDLPEIKHFANYAWEGLKRIRDNESKFAATIRHVTGISQGIFHFWLAFKGMAPMEIVNGLLAMESTIQDVVKFCLEVKAKLQYEGTSSFKEGKILIRGLKWFEEARYVELLTTANCFNAMELFLAQPSRRKHPSLMYIAVVKLNEVVLTHSDLTTRKETISFLASIYQDDKIWSGLLLKDEHYKKEGPALTDVLKREEIALRLSLKAKIIECLQQYHQIPDLKEHAAKTLQTLEVQTKSRPNEMAFIYRHRQKTPDVKVNPVNNGSEATLIHQNPQKEMEIETKLENMRLPAGADEAFKREKELYVAAQGTQQQDNNASFDLMKTVLAFLQGNQRVLLLLGDNGSGRSFFCQFLLEHLWSQYKQMVGIIPLFISLPSLQNPTHNLFSEFLESRGFSKEEIAYLKEKREFLLVLDEYNGIGKHADILQDNLMGLKGKVIVTSRSETLSSEDLFIPTVGGKPQRMLLNKTFLVPFSKAQIDQYLQRYVSQGSRKWKQAAQFQTQIEKMDLQELTQNPRMLKIITDLLADTIESQKSSNPVQIRNAVYKAIMDEWFEQGFNSVRRLFSELEKVGLDPRNLKEEARKYCIQLAKKFQARKAMQVQYVPATMAEWDPFFGNDLKAATLRSMAPLKVMNERRYGFLSKSLLDYFGAQESQDSQAKTAPRKLTEGTSNLPAPQGAKPRPTSQILPPPPSLSNPAVAKAPKLFPGRVPVLPVPPQPKGAVQPKASAASGKAVRKKPLPPPNINVDDLLARKLKDSSIILSTEESIALLTECIRRGREQAEKAHQKDLVIVIGNTGAGKSTFINYLYGCTMARIDPSEIGVKALNDLVIVKPVSKGGAINEIMPIGHSKQSATFIPQIESDPQGLTYCDCPGFLDNRDKMIKVANAANTRNVFIGARSVRILILINYYALLSNRAQGLTDMISITCSLFGAKENLIHYKKSLFLGITQVPLISPGARKRTLQQLKEWMIDEEVKGKLTDFEYGTLQHLSERLFIYDPLDESNLQYSDSLSRKQIIDSIQGLEKIPNPLKIFRTVLSDEDLHYLSQISGNIKESIQAVFKKPGLSEDDYGKIAGYQESLRALEVLDHPHVLKLMGDMRKTISDHFHAKIHQFEIACGTADCTDAETMLNDLKNGLPYFDEQTQKEFDLERLEQRLNMLKLKVRAKAAQAELNEMVGRFRQACNDSSLEEAASLHADIKVKKESFERNYQGTDVQHGIKMAELEALYEKTRLSLLASNAQNAIQELRELEKQFRGLCENSDFDTAEEFLSQIKEKVHFFEKEYRETKLQHGIKIAELESLYQKKRIESKGQAEIINIQELQKRFYKSCDNCDFKEADRLLATIQNSVTSFEKDYGGVKLQHGINFGTLNSYYQSSKQRMLAEQQSALLKNAQVAIAELHVLETQFRQRCDQANFQEAEQFLGEIKSKMTTYQGRYREAKVPHGINIENLDSYLQNAITKKEEEVQREELRRIQEEETHKEELRRIEEETRKEELRRREEEIRREELRIKEEKIRREELRIKEEKIRKEELRKNTERKAQLVKEAQSAISELNRLEMQFRQFCDQSKLSQAERLLGEIRDKVSSNERKFQEAEVSHGINLANLNDYYKAARQRITEKVADWYNEFPVLGINFEQCMKNGDVKGAELNLTRIQNIFNQIKEELPLNGGAREEFAKAEAILNNFELAFTTLKESSSGPTLHVGRGPGTTVPFGGGSRIPAPGPFPRSMPRPNPRPAPIDPMELRFNLFGPGPVQELVDDLGRHYLDTHIGLLPIVGRSQGRPVVNLNEGTFTIDDFGAYPVHRR